MTRRRSSAPGRSRPDRRRSFLVLAAVLALVLSACGGSNTPSPSSAASSPDASSGSLPSTTPDASDAATDQPTDEPSDSAEPTDEPSDSAEPTDEPTDSAEPTPSGGGAADACTGTPENQKFYASVAAAVDWSVYCPALPNGWFVQSGSYSLRGGARLEISYRGPAGAHIDLKEGAFCSSSDGCVPGGTDGGTASFGDREGDVVAVGDDSWAVSVDAGSNPSWLLTGTGLSEAAFRTIASDLVIVGG